MLLTAAPAVAQRVVAPPPIPAGTSAIGGRITDSITKQPIAGCKLRIGTGGAFVERITDHDGAYELKDVVAGNYFVNFELVPGAAARGQVMSFDGRPITRANVRLGRGEWRLEVQIPPEPGGLRPPIVYYPGGLSWEEAAGVELEPGKVKDRLTIAVQRIDMNAEGIGTLKGVVPGRYFVAARAASRDKQWAGFEVVDFIEDSYEARL